MTCSLDQFVPGATWTNTSIAVDDSGSWIHSLDFCLAAIVRRIDMNDNLGGSGYTLIDTSQSLDRLLTSFECSHNSRNRDSRLQWFRPKLCSAVAQMSSQDPGQLLRAI